MATEVPRSAYEAATAEGREKMRNDRRKILSSLPQSKISQDYLANVEGHIMDIREGVEDLVLLVDGMDAGEMRPVAADGQETVRGGGQNEHYGNSGGIRQNGDCSADLQSRVEDRGHGQ